MNTSPKQKQSASIRPGDVFALGEHRLMCGDARNADTVAKLMKNERISSIVVDPPYGCAYVESKAGFKQKLGKEKIIANDHEQSDEEYRAFTKDWMIAVRPVLADHNSAYIFSSDKMVFALRDGMRDA